MSFLKIGAGLVGAGLNSIKAEGIRNQIEKLLEDTPEIRISPDIKEQLASFLSPEKAYQILLNNVDLGVYAADKELLVSDALAVLATLYAKKTYASMEEKMVDGKKKVRVRSKGEVVEGLTTLILDNYDYISDKMRHDTEMVLTYMVYMTNKVAEETHESHPMGGAPKTYEYRSRIMILLDCISRIESANRDRDISVNNPLYKTYKDDEIAYIRSKLKPPLKNWQRGEYDWEKEDSCWIVTAFYGDPFHPDVVAIRDFRSSLVEVPFLGKWVSSINDGYHFLGKTTFGVWWRDEVARSKYSIPHILSGNLVKIAQLANRLLSQFVTKQS